MGASSYTFACATPAETMEDWLGGIARALTFYGSVPQLIVRRCQEFRVLRSVKGLS
jgi:transposase